MWNKRLVYSIVLFVIAEVVCMALPFGANAEDPPFQEHQLPSDALGLNQPNSLGSFFGKCAVGNVNFAGFEQIKDALKGNVVNPQLGSAATSLFGGGGSCSEPGEPQTSISCSLLQEDGYFSEKRVEEIRADHAAIQGSISCKKNSLNAINTELECLSREGKSLAEEIARLEGPVTLAIQEKQKEVRELQTMIDDRKSQDEEVQSKLKGDEKSGNPGLIATQAQIKTLVAAMPAQVQDIEERLRATEFQRRRLEEVIQTRELALAGECLKTRTESSYRCTPNGKVVSGMEYLSCRFGQNMTIGKDGKTRERGDSTKTRSAAETAALNQLIQAMLNEFPAQSELPQGETNVQNGGTDPTSAYTDQVKRVGSVAEIKKRYLKRFRKFNIKGINTVGFMNKQFDYCKRDAKKIVGKEKKRESSAIGRFKYSVKTAENDFKKKFDEYMDLYRQNYGDITKSLTEQNLNLNVDVCRSGKPPQKIECMKEAKTKFEAILSGTGADGLVRMNITGTDPSKAIVFDCAGLNGCVASLQRLSKNLTREVKRVEAFKKEFIPKVNNNIHNFIKGLAQSMNGMSQKLWDRVKSINKALANLGVSGGVNLKKINTEQLKPGEDGVYEVPQDLAGVIGGQMNPKLLDVNEDTFDSALRGIASANQKIGRTSEKLARAEARLNKKAESCKRRDLDKLVRLAQVDANSLANMDCSQQAICSGTDSVQDLVNDINRIAGDVGDSGVASLGTGIEGICQGSGNQDAYDALQKLYNECVVRNGGSEVNCSIEKANMNSALANTRTGQFSNNGRSCNSRFASLKGKVGDIEEAVSSFRSTASEAN